MILGHGAGHLPDKTGDFGINDVSVAAQTSYTHIIDLGDSGFNNGQLQLMLPDTVPSSTHRRRGSFIMFTTILDQAVAQSGGKTTYVIVGYYGIPYYFTDLWIKSYYPKKDNKLSDGFFSIYGDRIQISSCRINGTNLEITFFNGYSAGSRTLRIDGVYCVRK